MYIKNINPNYYLHCNTPEEIIQYIVFDQNMLKT